MTTWKNAELIQPGDEVQFLDEAHIIRDVCAYTGTIVGLDTSTWRLASDGFGWVIALVPGQPWRVAA